MFSHLQKLALGAGSVFTLIRPLAVHAQTYNFASSSGLNGTADAAGYTEALKALQPESLAGQIIAQILAWLGVVFLGLVIYGGITWMTAEGNEQKVDKAKQILTAAVSGLIVVSIAYAASYFVIQYFA